MEVVIGVLAFQGAFHEHLEMLRRIPKPEDVNLRLVEVKKPEQIDQLDALILPGGESTTMSIFLSSNNFVDKLKNWMNPSSTPPPPVWGTCAGLILLSNEIEGQKKGGQVNLGGLSVKVSRNYFGGQINSFEADLVVADSQYFKRSPNHDGAQEQVSQEQTHHAVFIRAPGIIAHDPTEVEVLARLGDVVVAVKQGNLVATCFHPELTRDPLWHQSFLHLVIQRKRELMSKDNKLQQQE
eukprot:TRINITY_DN3216_c0_g1_i1.p1 TRINITY_DN3216_c0_g1~~TRINITY_DN3216_c0_g1_i1.p1  ORF type:complete len:239 (-),score=52.02 TRINITY_DN3216_c0_g1_i1:283-999(-)